jgi:hypothetical protein
MAKVDKTMNDRKNLAQLEVKIDEALTPYRRIAT